MNNRRFVSYTTTLCLLVGISLHSGLQAVPLLQAQQTLGPTFEPSFSFDGRRLLVSSTASLWDIETGLELQAFRDHLDPVFAVALSPDGKRVLTGGGRTGDLPSRDTSIRLWSVETGMEIRRFIGHPSSIQIIQFSPDGTRMMSVGGDVRVWDIETGRQLFAIPGGASPLLPGDARLSPDGLKILSNSTNAARRVISDASSGKAICTIENSDGMVWSAAFSPDSSLVVTAGLRVARTWDAQTCEPRQLFASHTNFVLRASFTPDSNRVLTASEDSTARLWDAKSGQQLKRYEQPGPVEDVLLSPDGTRFLTRWQNALKATGPAPPNRSCVSLWATDSGREIRRFCDEPGPNMTWQTSGIVGFSPDGTTIPIVDLSRRPLSLWNAVTGERIREYTRER